MSRVIYKKPCRIENKESDGPYNKMLKPNVSNWAIGITVSPRPKENQYYTRTIDSVIRAGWKNPHLFIEPDTELAERHLELPRIDRKEKYGCWKNWFEGLKELVEIYPDADCYGMIQDDVVFCRGVRVFLEKVLWPNVDVGLVSVFTPSHYTEDKPGFYRRNYGGKLWMAQTFFFPPDRAKNCINHAVCTGHDGDRNIDNIIGRWLYRIRKPPYYFSPSLSQHIGETSTLWNNNLNQAKGRKSAKDFVGEDYDISHGMTDESRI